MASEALNLTLLRATLDGDCCQVAILLDQGADIEARASMRLPEPLPRDRCSQALEYAASRGATPLTLAAGSGHTEVVNLLLGRGARINGGDKFYQSPIGLAVWIGQRETTRLLLDAGANVNDGRTDEGALGQWAQCGYPDLVCAL